MLQKKCKLSTHIIPYRCYFFKCCVSCFNLKMIAGPWDQSFIYSLVCDGIKNGPKCNSFYN